MSIADRRRARSLRAAPWDVTGANSDLRHIEPGETQTLLDVEGPGRITKVYCASGPMPLTYFRDMVLRMWWDDEDAPSVETPLGDLFLLSHARVRLVDSEYVAVNPGIGWSYGLNLYLPMPFRRRALVTLEHRGGYDATHLLQFEYERGEQPPEALWFHASYRQERPTAAIGPQPGTMLHDAVNLTGEHNYVALEAAGAGHMVGIHLQIANRTTAWYGEGDDMVFVDGDTWPPSIHGTGTEEVFGGGACPNREYARRFSGMHLVERPDYRGLVGMYRWWEADAIAFEERLRWTVEHGHANNFANDYASVAYWYQTEPHLPAAALPGPEAILPPLDDAYEHATAVVVPALAELIARWVRATDPGEQARLIQQMGRADAYYAGRFDEARASFAG